MSGVLQQTGKEDGLDKSFLPQTDYTPEEPLVELLTSRSRSEGPPQELPGAKNRPFLAWSTAFSLVTSVLHSVSWAQKGCAPVLLGTDTEVLSWYASCCLGILLQR